MATYYYSKNQNSIKPISHVKIASPVKEKTPSVGEKLLHTTGDVFANIIAGAAKGLEGIVDLGAGIGGAIAGIFDKDARDKVRSFVSRDFTGDFFANRWQQDLKYSYLNDGKVGQFAEKTLNAVGQMLPAVGVGLITGGAGLAAGASQAASLAAMGASAAGTSTEEAFNDGADYYKGLGYGMASGAVEMATEKMSGGALKGIIGKGMLDGVGKVAATGAKRVLKNAVEEGAEEVVSELANPALKSIYKGKEAFEEYRDADYWKGVAEAGLVGGATSVVYGGTVGKVLAKTGHGYVGKEADIAESLEKVGELEHERSKLWTEGKLTEEENAKILKYIDKNKTNVEIALRKTEEGKRARTMEKFNLGEEYDENGKWKRDLQSNAEVKKYCSPNTNQARISSDLNDMTESLRKRYARENGVGMSEAVKQIPEMRVYEGELTGNGENNYSKFKKALNKLNSVCGVDVGVAVLSPQTRINGAIIDKNMYISADNFEDGTWIKTLVHEYTHLSEGTREYRKLVDYLISDKKLVADAETDYTKRYGRTEENHVADIDPRKESEYNQNTSINEQFSRKSYYNQYSTTAKIWSHETGRRKGDKTVLYNSRKGTIDTIIADDSDEGYRVVKSSKRDSNRTEFIKERKKNGNYSRKSGATGEIRRFDASTEDGRLNDREYTRIASERRGIDGVGEIHNKQSDGDGLGYTVQSVQNSGSNLGRADNLDVSVKINEIEKNLELLSEGAAIMSEKVFGTEAFADKLIKYNPSLFGTVLNRISEAVRSFANSETKADRERYKFLRKAESLYLNAVKQAGYKYVNGKIIRPEKDFDGTTEVKYNKKDKFIGKTFPPYSESFSEANERATRWAYRNDVQSGDRIAISFNDKWYAIEKFEDLDLRYRIVAQLTEKQYQEYLEESINGVGKGQPIQERISGLTSIDRRTDTVDGRIVLNDTVSSRNGRSNNEVRGLGQEQLERGQAGSNRSGNSESGGSGEQIKYSLKTAKYIPYDKIGSDNIRAIRKKLNDLYQGIDDAVADGIAIENGDTVYVVDSGKDSGEIKFGVRERYEITNDELRAEFVRRINYESVSKRYISDGLSSRFRFEYAHDRTRNRRQEPGKELSVDTRESADKEKRISVDNADRRSGFVKYSLKTDSDGRQLSEGQKEFFKDSKVVDEQGRLLVVYHGTKAVFTEFDRAKVGLNGSQEGQGIYFTDNKDFAEGYSNEKGQLLEGYLNIKKPLSDNERTLTKKQVESIIRKLDPSGDELLSNYSTDSRYYGTAKHEMWYESALRETLDSVMKYCDTDSEIMAELSNAGAGSENVLKVLFDQFGYDGYIVKGKYKDTNVYVAFDSSQFKNADNRIPTGSKDIRYSLKPFSEDVLTGEHDSNYVNIRFSLKEDADGKYVSVNLDAKNQIFLGKLNIQERRKFVKDYIKNTFRNVEFALQDGKVVIITGTGAGKISQSSYLPKQRTALEMEDLFRAAEYLSTVENPNHKKFVRFDYYKARVELEGTYYSCVLNFGVTRDGGLCQLYDVNQFREIKKDTPTELNLQQGSTKSMRPISNVSFSNNISNYREDVNHKVENSEKIKYSVKETDESVRKYAQNNAEKVYAKSDAREVLKRVCACLEFDDGSYGDISGHKGKTVDMLYDALNTKPEGERYKVALDIADYILSNVTLGNIYADEAKRAAIQEAITTIDTLRPFLHNLNLNSIKGDIRHRYDKNNRPFLLWKARPGNFSVTPNVVAQYLAEKGIRIKSENEADIFFEIDDMYMQARSAVKSEEKKYFKEVFDKDELAKLRNEMAKEILLGYDNTGEKSAYARMKDKYEQKVAKLKEKVSSIAEINSAQNELIESLNKLKKAKTGEFFNSTQYKPEIFKGSIEKLTRMNYRGDINKSGTRKIVKELRQWYSPENDIFRNAVDLDEDMKFRSRNSFNPEIANVLDFVIEGEGELSLIELKGMKYVIDYFTHFIENHNKIYRGGKYVEAVPVAAEYVRIARENKNYNMGWLENAYTRVFGDPASVVRLMDKYERGFYTEIYEELRNGAMEAQIKDMEMRSALEEFFKKNKRYVNRIAEEKVKYYVGDDASKAKEINKDVAIALYLTLKRKQALKGLAHSGFLYVENGKDVRVPGFLGTDVEVTDELIGDIADVLQKRLYGQFSDADKQYINVVEKVLNEDCKKAKYETDMRRQGYSNVLEDYYFPIRRAFVAKNVDDGFMEEINSVSNASMNKNTKRGAKNELLISPVNEVVDRHIRAVAMYSSLAEAIDNYNILFNVDVAENKNKPFSVRTETSDIWRKKNDSTMAHRADEYFRKLVKDIQGISADGKTVGAKVLSFVRGGYAKFQLGFNVKVLFSQLSSYIAASNTISSKALAKGFGVKGSDVDKYCRLAALRNFDKTAIKAQGVIDKVGAVGDVLMTPISKVDRFVVQRLFGACQAQAKINGKGAIGTESNLVAAGELLTKVILETQQNSLATERSAAMRSGNEFMKGITMFTADSMKCVGRVIDAIGEVTVLKKKIKNCTDSATAQKYRNQLKTAQKKAAKSVTALVTVSVYMACIAQLFRWLYKRDDDENVIETMSLDAVGNLLGGLPLIKDLYAKLVDGFDLDNYAYGVINDLFDSADGIIKTFEKVVSGDAEKQDFTSLVKKMIYAAGQLFGIPVRNMYNMATGITKRISPAAGYKIDSFFYDKNYRSDLKKAIEDGDEKMIATIAGLIMNEDIGDIKDKSVREEFNALVKDGYDVLPRTIGKEIAVSDGTYTLNRKEKKYIESMYDDAAESLSNIMKTARYRNASKSVRAKTIKNTYKMYYEKAVEEITDEENLGKSALYSQVFDPALLAFVLAAVSNLKKDENSENGTRKRMIEYYLSSLNLTSAQKILIMGYLGYKTKENENSVRAYIARYDLSTAEQKALLAHCGY